MDGIVFQSLVLDKLDQLQGDVSGLKQDVSILKTDVSELKADVSILKTDVAGLKADVAILKTDVAELKTDVAALKTRSDAIIEQTAGLMEFRTETNLAVTDIRDSMRSVTQLLGEHEVQIRNLQRRAVS